MLTLLTYQAGFGQFSLSPFCVKAAAMLAWSGQPWRREDMNDPRKMPHRKLPVLRAPEGLIAGSDRIGAYLADKGAAFDAGLDARQKAISHALIRMAEEHLYFLLVLDRWGNEAVWPVIRETYFDAIPGLLRGPVTRRLRQTLLRGLDVQGLLRLSPDDRMRRANEDLAATAACLSDQPFLMGDAPTRADFSMVPMLAALASTPVETALSRRVATDPILMDYMMRFDEAVPLDRANAAAA